MALTKFPCPHCEAPLQFKNPVANGKLVRCPKCTETFRLDIDEPEEKPRKKKSARASDERPAARGRKKGGNTGLLIGGAVAAVVVLAAVVGLVAWTLRSPNEATPTTVAQGPTQPTAPATQKPKPPDTTWPKPTNRETTKPDDGKTKAPALPPPPPPLPPEKQPVLVLDSGGHTEAVRNVFFTPDNRFIVTPSLDKTIRIWDAHSGECLRTIRMPVGPGREGGIQSAALSPDGKTLAVAVTPYADNGSRALVHQVSLLTGEVVAVFKKHNDGVNSLAYSPDNKYLAVGTMNGIVRVYPAQQDEPVKEFRGHTNRVTAIAWSPDSAQLASASFDSTACLWSLKQNQPTATLKHTAPVLSVTWQPDGKGLATGGHDGWVRLWTGAGAAGKSYNFKQTDPSGPPAPFQFATLVFHKDGKDLLYAGVAYRGEAGLINAETGEKRPVPFHDNTVLAGAFSPDGERAVTTGGNNNETFVWQVGDGGQLYGLPCPGQAVWGLAWSEDGNTIAWGNTNRGSTVLNQTPIERGFSLETFDLGKPADRNLRAVLGLGDLELKSVDFFHIGVFPKGKKEGRSYRSPYDLDRLYSASLLPEGRLLLGGSFGDVFLMDDKGQLVRTFRGHSGMVLGIVPSTNYKYFASCSSDQTIRIWSVDRELPLMTLFVAGSDWIAWTPEGYYSASANGERLMGWQVNNGLEKTGTYYPAIQFRASLYRPDVMKALFKAGTLDKALAMCGGNRQQVQVSQVLPPRVDIIAPAPQGGTVEVGGNTVEVKAAAQSFANYPVTSMRLLLDGRPYLGTKGLRTFTDGKAGRVEATWSVALPPGKHSIAVLAESPVSKGVSATLEVNRTNAKDELPNLYILAVGVSDYPGRLKLNYAASDAVLIAQTFQSKTKGVFGNVEVKTILNRDATKQAITEGIAWLGTKMSPVDVGILFFSGHGARDDDTGQFYLVPVDVNVSAPPEKWGVSGDYVKEALANMPGRLIAMFDACHSGTVAESFKPSRGDNLVRNLVNDDYGVIVLCSSLGSEYSLESGATKAGFFTLGLTEGLNGRADFNRDKVIHLSELSIYSALRVKQLSGGEQNPIVGKPPHVKSFVVGKP